MYVEGSAFVDDPMKGVFWMDIPGIGFDLTMFCCLATNKCMNINRVDIICTLVTIQLLSVLIYLIAYFLSHVY